MTPSTRTGDTRQRLLEAGMQAFITQGFHGTGIKAIVDAVGVPKGSFYNYFESKDAFGAATVAYYADCMGRKLGGALGSAPDPVAGLRAFFEAEMRSFEESGYVGGCLVANLGAELEGSDRLNAALAEALGRYVGGITAAIASAQGQGLVRRDVPAADLGRLLVDAWEGAVIRMKIERSSAPLEQCLTRLLDGFFGAG